MIRLKEYVPYTKTVNIQRAPTDESIKFYEEFKEKAYNSVIRSIHLDNNDIKATCILYRDVYSFSTVLKFRFLLNGKEFLSEESVKEDITKEDMEYRLFSLISKRITEMLFKQIKRDGL